LLVVIGLAVLVLLGVPLLSPGQEMEILSCVLLLHVRLLLCCGFLGPAIILLLLLMR
jgi:hypothetical protein